MTLIHLEPPTEFKPVAPIPVPAALAVAPVYFQLKVYRGANYAARLELKDEETGEPFPLEGWTVTMTRNGLITLTIENGLAVPTPVNGVVDLLLPPAVTKGYPVGKFHSVLWLAREATKLVPAAGTTQVLDP